MPLVLRSGSHALPVELATPPRADSAGGARISVSTAAGPTSLPREGTLVNGRGETLAVTIEWSIGLSSSIVTHRLAFGADDGAAFDWDG